MKKKISKKLKRRKQRIQYRLPDINWKEQNKPMFSASNIHYDIADRTRGLAYGGIGGILVLARQTGLVKAIDDKLKLLKRHLPYYESDHVLKREKQTVLKMEFKKFRNAFIQLPCQIIKTGRKIVYRLSSWNRWLVVFFRGLKMLRYPLRC